MVKKVLFLFLISILIASCKEEKKEAVNKNIPKETQKIVKDKTEPVINEQLTDFVGLYEYKNVDNPKESLFLVLEKVDPKSIPNFEGYSWKENNENREEVEKTLAGLLYGNTDLFDDVREGYAPGFFVANVQVEPFHNNALRVSIDGDSSVIFENPIPLTIKSSKEALAKGNKIWEVTEMDISRNLTFEIKNSDELILKSDLGSDDITFSKTK
ncbi:hypothetical protein C8C83_5037 [Flavobacterium sp. 90]|uniref:hypothetical protein n=1 Tax=unclassified Flavobacterium TaxID=196869 RepID=UPI000EAF4A98|nr:MULTISPECIES: hypothetical protein [unclassified Flavobacterium]RKR05686.1 hypothetical protein C8C82_5381 [Flavobacterium sp. 81]TCK56999.1 hypothetical protein C8C83_5037 [Flavobacterium sp. 90]